MDHLSRVADQGETSTIPEANQKARLAARSRARIRFNQGMRVVRRVHLYAGLFMVPWVFLYGISAMLFNHPDAFADAPSLEFSAADTRSTALESVPRAEALAKQVVDALNQKSAAKKTEGTTASEPPAYRLVAPLEASFNRDLAATVRGDGKEYNVRLSLLDGSGKIRAVEKKGNKPAPFASKAGLKLESPPFESVTKGLPELLGKLGMPAREASIRTVPDLSFMMEGPKSEVWRVTYNAGTNQVTGRPAESSGAGPSLRRELTLMHLAHGFPNQVNARWVWAIFVDLMFVSMVGWGATGLAMWWQMKNVRTVGAIVLIASLITATLLAIAMHSTFIAEGVS